jgi:hypothetical protein
MSEPFPREMMFGNERVEVLGVSGGTGRKGEPLGEPTLEALNERGGQVVVKLPDGSTAITFAEQLKPLRSTAKPPAEKAPEAAPVEAETMSLQKATINEMNRLMGRPEAEAPERSSWDSNVKAAMDQKLDQTALDLAREMEYAPRPITKEEHAGMVIKAVDIKKRLNAIEERLSAAIEKGDDRTADQLRGELNRNNEDMGLLLDASNHVGTEGARAFNIRKMMIRLEDLSVAGALRQATIAKGRGLTRVESLKIEELARDYQKALKERDALRADYDKLVAQREKEIAETVVKRNQKRVSVMEKTEKAKAKLAKQREDLKSQIAALGDARFNDITGLSAEGSFLLGKLALNYVREGAVTMESLLQRLKRDYPKLEDRDIYQALVARDPKYVARERSEISKRIAEMKTQAGLMLKIEKAEQGIFEGPAKKPRTPAPPEIEALRRQFRELRRQATKTIRDGAQLERAQRTLAKLQHQLDTFQRDIKRKQKPAPADVQAIREQIKQVRHEMHVEDQIAILTDQLRTGEFPVRVKQTLARPPAELERREVTLSTLRKQVRKAIMDLEPPSKFAKIGEAVEFLRTTKATADWSGTLRQGYVLLSRRLLIDPMGLAKDFGRAAEASIRPYKAEALDYAIRNAPDHYKREMAGLFLSDIDGRPTAREEVFQSKLIDKIPGLRQVAAMSNRHMASFLNLLRADAFDRFMDTNPNATLAEMKAAARMINAFSGRGNLNLGPTASKVAGTAMFAPRFAWSRVETPWYVFNKNPRVRAEAMKSMVSTAATGMAFLSLAHFGGFEVGLDPADSEFGKIRIGNTRIDVWGGLQQPMRVVMAIIVGGLEHNWPETWLGEIPWDKGKPRDPLDLISRFGYYKMSPIAGLGYSALTGKTIIGTPLKIAPEGWSDIPNTVWAQSLFPLIVNDIWEAAVDGGLARGAMVAPWVFLGGGASTYEKQERGGGPPKPGKPQRTRPGQ